MKAYYSIAIAAAALVALVWLRQSRDRSCREKCSTPSTGFAQKVNSQARELPAWIRRGGRDQNKCCEASSMGADGAVD